jgi:hypothetical protein
VVATDKGGQAVVDVATGEVLVSGSGTFDLSPDGRYARLVAGDDMYVDPAQEVPMQVFDLDSGESVTIVGPSYDWGWTADGDLFHVDEGEVRTCDSATGECTTESFEMPTDLGKQPGLKVGGRLYES